MRLREAAMYGLKDWVLDLIKCGVNINARDLVRIYMAFNLSLKILFSVIYSVGLQHFLWPVRTTIFL